MRTCLCSYFGSGRELLSLCVHPSTYYWAKLCVLVEVLGCTHLKRGFRFGIVQALRGLDSPPHNVHTNSPPTR